MPGSFLKSRNRLTSIWMAALALCLACPSLLPAQTTYGSLTGSVRDPQGLSVAGASVIARNLATNATLTVASSDVGAFELPVLPRGEYEVTVEVETGAIHGTFPPRALKLVLEWVSLHTAELLENWQLAKQGQPLKRIAPLE